MRHMTIVLIEPGVVSKTLHKSLKSPKKSKEQQCLENATLPADFSVFDNNL